jgi:hypothetical protein
VSGAASGDTQHFRFLSQGILGWMEKHFSAVHPKEFIYLSYANCVNLLQINAPGIE